MSAKTFVDRIRKVVVSQGHSVRMAKGRDLIARMLFDKSYSAAIAAEAAGKLPPPRLDPTRTTRLRESHGKLVNAIADVIKKLSHEDNTMTATQAIAQGLIPSPPQLALTDVARLQAIAQAHGGEIEQVSVDSGNLHQGRHLQFLHSGGTLHALEDLYLADQTAHLTARLDGAVLRLRGADDEDGDSHHFLSWQLRNREWALGWSEHRLAEPEDMDRTYLELGEEEDKDFLASQVSLKSEEVVQAQASLINAKARLASADTRLSLASVREEIAGKPDSEALSEALQRERLEALNEVTRCHITLGKLTAELAALERDEM